MKEEKKKWKKKKEKKENEIKERKWNKRNREGVKNSGRVTTLRRKETEKQQKEPTSKLGEQHRWKKVCFCFSCHMPKKNLL